MCGPFDTFAQPRRGGGGVAWSGDASPFVRPDQASVAAQQRWPDGLVPASPRASTGWSCDCTCVLLVNMLVSSLIVSSKPAYRNLMQLAAAILRRGSAAH